VAYTTTISVRRDRHLPHNGATDGDGSHDNGRAKLDLLRQRLVHAA